MRRRPFLVYAYLHEELANAVLSKPDLRKKSLLVDGGLQEDEARRLDAEWRECERRKSGAEVEEAYLKGMGARRASSSSIPSIPTTPSAACVHAS